MTKDILMDKIDKYASYNLLFTKGMVDGLNYIDVGYKLSLKIKTQLSSSNLPMQAEDELNAILCESVTCDKLLGNYLALCNIGILFEPQLKLNVRAIIERNSRQQVLIVNMEGRISDKKFHLAGSSEQMYTINLSDIPYKIVNDEI